MNLKSCHILSLEEEKWKKNMSSPTHNNFVQPYLHTNHKRSENFHPMHQTKKNSNLGKGMKIVASTERPCLEVKREHNFS